MWQSASGKRPPGAFSAMRIDGKVVLITGASEGIGAACAAEFARAGARLSLTARSEDGLRRAGGPDALITAGDLTDEAARRRAVDRTIERFGAIDILINNAGMGFYCPSWRAPMEETRRLMELNFFAVLGITQLVVPHMRERRSGMIVNVGSIAGKFTLPWMTIYSASKFALGSLTEGLRMELKRDIHSHSAGVPRLRQNRLPGSRLLRPDAAQSGASQAAGNHRTGMRHGDSPRCGARRADHSGAARRMVSS